MISSNFDKQTKKLAWPIVAKDLKLKNHWDLKKFSVPKKHLHQIDCRGWQTGPPLVLIGLTENQGSQEFFYAFMQGKIVSILYNAQILEFWFN